MRSNEVQPRLRWLTRLGGLVMLAASALSLLGLMLTQNLTTPARAQTTPIEAAALADSPAYLYQFQQDTGTFITLSLPLNSRPAALAVVTGTTTDRLWYTSPDRNRLGQVVYTSTASYTTTEYVVPDRPGALAASAADVWFTLPQLGQVGHLAVGSGVIVTMSLSPISGTLSDLALDSRGQAWVAQRVGNQVKVTALSTTLGVSTTYVISPGSFTPGGLTIDGLDHVWLGARDSHHVWHLDPATAAFDASISLGVGRQPGQLAHDSAGNYIWTVLPDNNQVARLPRTLMHRAELFTLPVINSQPGALIVDGLDRVYVVQSANSHLARLTVTSTASFDDIVLPRPGVTATAIAAGRENTIWAIAYFEPPIQRVLLPVISHNYDSLVPAYGVQNYWALTAQYGLTRIVESKVSWVRFPVYWSSIEPVNTTPDNYNWSGADVSLRAVSAPTNLIITVAGNPSWAASSTNGPVNDLADLLEFVDAIVRRYPNVKYWEFYNEPDNAAWYGLKGAEYAQMLQAVYPVVKAANPAAQVVMGGLALDWFIEDGGPFDRNFLRDVLINCAGPCFDLANFHYYPAFRKHWEAYGRDIIGKANYVRQILAAYNYVRPVINTETGWPSGTNWGSLELQARYVPKVYVRGMVANLPTVIWFSLIDSDHSLPGLMDTHLNIRPAYDVLRALITTLPQARYVRTISASETGSTFIEAYQFSVTSPAGIKRVDVYWYDCPSMVSYEAYPSDCASAASLRLKMSQVTKIDKLGNRSLVNDANDGTPDGYVTLSVTSSPIYIEY